MGCNCSEPAKTLPATGKVANACFLVCSCETPESIYTLIPSTWPEGAALAAPSILDGRLVFTEVVTPPEGFISDTENTLLPIWPICRWRMFFQQVSTTWTLVPICNRQPGIQITVKDCEMCLLAK